MSLLLTIMYNLFNHLTLKKFYKMNQSERLRYLKKITELSAQDIAILQDPSSAFSFDNANTMIENAIGIFALPLGIATNFVINGKEYLLPMAIEEPSIIAAASKAAKIAKSKGGFIAEADESIMIGQIQIVSLPISEESAKINIVSSKKEILELASSKSRFAVVKDLQVRQVQDKSQHNKGVMLLVELVVDTKDAMGANIVNTMCESIAPVIEQLTGGKVILKIISNYATKRLVKCKAIFDKNELGGQDIVERILYAYAFAYSDVYRAVTHNKGVMNGIDAVALATGQDFRAIEAGAHAYAARDGTYRSMTNWNKTEEGDLAGEIELPMATGIVGGVASVHPIAKLALKILGVKTSKELAIILAAVGLAQNFAAIRALASEGIQKGHMRLHARNIAAAAGATGNQIEIVANKIAEERTVNIDRAKEILALINKDNNSN
ncbi:MAG TPA: hydroxymethylglutaryl-CoA reductase, degradative [Nitrososphaeraceae archaeon]|nr:hydroxymethylglutaryl-CoA reductase, degradative [Nitrososphaeraceae archaeon]